MMFSNFEGQNKLTNICIMPVIGWGQKTCRDCGDFSSHPLERETELKY